MICTVQHVSAVFEEVMCRIRVSWLIVLFIVSVCSGLKKIMIKINDLGKGNHHQPIIQVNVPDFRGR